MFLAPRTFLMKKVWGWIEAIQSIDNAIHGAIPQRRSCKFPTGYPCTPTLLFLVSNESFWNPSWHWPCGNNPFSPQINPEVLIPNIPPEFPFLAKVLQTTTSYFKIWTPTTFLTFVVRFTIRSDILCPKADSSINRKHICHNCQSH